MVPVIASRSRVPETSRWMSRNTAAAAARPIMTPSLVCPDMATRGAARKSVGELVLVLGRIPGRVVVVRREQVRRRGLCRSPRLRPRARLGAWLPGQHQGPAALAQHGLHAGDPAVAFGDRLARPDIA